MLGQYVAWAAVAAVLLYLIVIYNGLVTIKNGVLRAWSNIDVLLKQRHDEVPKLVEVCKAYMQFERETLERVMQARAGATLARTQGNVAAVGSAESALSASVGRIVATVEAYPELRANQSIQQLLSRITSLENQIADRRELYNEYVTLFNIRIERFPDVAVARAFGFQARQMLSFGAAETADVDVRALFRS
ncbi:MAG: LemA family protein [Nevskia sp.]|nr:LemA family protein [Nevskia sp.]